MTDVLELPFPTVRLKPLAVRVLAHVVTHAALHREAVITSDVVSALSYDAVRKEHSTVSKRLSELHQAGMIRPAGSLRKSLLTGKQQSEWLPTEAGRRFLQDRAGEGSATREGVDGTGGLPLPSATGNTSPARNARAS